MVPSDIGTREAGAGGQGKGFAGKVYTILLCI
jgi:hypothetical protein